MSLVTLSGVIANTDLQNNFEDKISVINPDSPAGGSEKTYYQIDFETISTLINTTSDGTQLFDITVPDDMELLMMALQAWSPDATSRTITVTLGAVDSTGTSVPSYVLNQTIQCGVHVTALAEFIAVRQDFRSSTGTKIFLVKGITYRLTFSSDSGTSINRAYGCLLFQQKRRTV